MAIDFPSSPTVGQIFTASNGTSWQWTGTVWVAAGTATGLITGAPNKLINPFMEIDQANEGAAVTGNYVVDGWKNSIVAVSTSAQRVTDAPVGYPNSIQVTISTSHAVAAGDAASLQYRIEAEELADTRFGTTGAQTLTLAFWVKSSVAGTYSASLRSTGGRSYYFPVVITAANTWQFITEVIPGDTAGSWVTSGNSLAALLDISLYTGSTYQGTTPHTWVAGTFLATNTISNTIATTVGATFQLGPAGLWVAPAAQPLLRTSFQAELARCQRYYEKSYNIGQAPGSSVGSPGAGSTYWIGAPNAAGSGTGFTVMMPFRTTKRANPTMSSWGANGVASFDYATSGGAWATGGVWNTLAATTNIGHGFNATSNITGVSFEWVADARL